MDDETVVFYSKITRSYNVSNNDLSELLQIAPATPISRSTVKQNICDYVPKADKYYIPKKKSGLKVRTVRNIRNAFEQDIYSNQIIELEDQRNLLFRKIRSGSLRDVHTKEIAKNILKNDKPISKSAWHMLMNINPDDHCYPFQYILWNGKPIRVNGSKGGKNKFITKYNFGKLLKNDGTQPTYQTLKCLSSKKKGLLQNSLHVKFKPGPLTRKKYLDNSYQKHNFGDMELVSLPKPGLELQPGYGKPLGPTVTTFLYRTVMQDSNCFVSEKWAELAVSMLGSNVKGKPSQYGGTRNISFDLSYKCLQNRILMRRDNDIVNNKFNNTLKNDNLTEDDSLLFSEIESVLSDIVQAVDISLNQDNMYTGEDELRENSNFDNVNPKCQFKEKQRKKFCELERLDVTVIQIMGASDKDQDKLCQNASCTFGCICNSLRCDYVLKNHCGQIECMFKCKCDMSSCKIMDSMEDYSDMLPGFINIDKKANVKLAKEEQKFHQTVIVTNDKSILLKSRKRDWQSSKTQSKPAYLLKNLSVVAHKLNCINIEPLCLVHNLYKCFCKGKFTASGVASIENKTENERSNNMENDNELTNTYETLNTRRLRYKTRKIKRKYCEETISDNIEINDDTSTKIVDTSTCARVELYKGRKYKNSYYFKTNLKVSELEKNDKKMHSKLLDIIKQSEVTDSNDEKESTEQATFCEVSNLRDLLTNVIEENMQCSSERTTFKDILKTPLVSSSKQLPYKSKIVSWLESSYKLYKSSLSQGLVKSCLDPPKAGKMALYPWDFILSRYRESKNHFLISKQKPFRIFMAVDMKKKSFEKCVNIRDIALCDLDKFPITVKNLLSNATDLLDNFCILYGLQNCWELIGSVTKVSNELRNDNVENETESLDGNWSPITISQAENTLQCQNIQKLPDTVNLDNSSNNTSELSKWFLMTIENDFFEIQFYHKGFFVRYDSVIRAINVARVSGKTVRLSAQINNSQQNDAQFGIYALPNKNSYCVFIGPYDKDEELGIETVKTVLKVGSNRTRGIWITTNKVDNDKVIANPLSFMVSANLCNEKVVPLECDSISTINDNDSVTLNTSTTKQQSSSVQEKLQTIKPIKVRKSNFLYNLSSTSLLKKAIKNGKIVKPVVVNKLTNLNNIDLTAKKTFKLLKTDKPVADTARLDKTYNNSLRKRREGGMFILNPEEINKRSFEKARHENSSESTEVDMLHLDIESFLDASVVRSAPNSEIYIISDDEEDCSMKEKIVDVYITCQSVKSLGWIPGQRNNDGFLRFTFPGFKETKFYPEKEAVEKMNQVISRKIYVPKCLNLKWQISESLTDSTKAKFTIDDLQSYLVVAKQDFRRNYAAQNNISGSNSLLQTTTLSPAVLPPDFLAQKENVLEDLEATSSALENESQILFDETVLKKVEIKESLAHASDDKREQLSETLNNLLWFDEDETVVTSDDA